ncbi:hypothetical protein [Helicobacter acinonychis]|uniref:hypothetical protein n=1 Tax=Helicobacter acinonychis TaxID=212 RepID=UPI000CF0DA66|nr:hypothetical protein [Helicobacter acinonychis]
MNIKERLSGSEYLRAVGLICGMCIFITNRVLYDPSGSASDPVFNPKDSYYMWLTLLIAALLSNLLFNPQGRDCYKSLQVRYPRFLKAIFKARFFGAFYDAVLGARLSDFYMVLLTMPFAIAMHEISAYCGHPSNFLVECLAVLGFLGFLRLCAKLGW